MSQDNTTPKPQVHSEYANIDLHLPVWFVDNFLPKLKGTETAVYLVLLRFASFNTHDCWPYIATIAEKAGVTPRCVQNALRKLVSLKLLRIDSGAATGEANTYWLLNCSEGHERVCGEVGTGVRGGVGTGVLTRTLPIEHSQLTTPPTSDCSQGLTLKLVDAPENPIPQEIMKATSNRVLQEIVQQTWEYYVKRRKETGGVRIIKLTAERAKAAATIIQQMMNDGQLWNRVESAKNALLDTIDCYLGDEFNRKNGIVEFEGLFNARHFEKFEKWLNRSKVGRK